MTLPLLSYSVYSRQPPAAVQVAAAARNPRARANHGTTTHAQRARHRRAQPRGHADQEQLFLLNKLIDSVCVKNNLCVFSKSNGNTMHSYSKLFLVPCKHSMDFRNEDSDLHFREKLLNRLKSLNFVEIDDVDGVTPGPWKINTDDLKNPAQTLERCVVRNEFGHLRMSGEYIGHCVLRDGDQDEVIKSGWGKQHDLAGHYHVAAKKVIPSNTTLLCAPRSDEDIEILWKIIQRSYNWVVGNEFEDSPEFVGSV